MVQLHCVYKRIMLNMLPKSVYSREAIIIYIALLCLVSLLASGDGRRFGFCGAVITVGSG